MVSNTIQCGFESHPGHCPLSVASTNICRMYPISVRTRGLQLLREGRTLSAVSRELGVHRSTIRGWRDQPLRARLGDCPRCDAAVFDAGAYSALRGYYLGDGCLSQQRRDHSFRVSCDARLPGIVADVTGLMKATRPRSRVFHVAAPGTVVVHANWKHWPCLFPQHGPGRKHDRTIALEPWQREIVEAQPWEFLRGLFHSDGSRTNNWATRIVAGQRKRYDYPRWEFVNRSDDILGLCAGALDLVEIAHRRPRATAIAVSRRHDVQRLDAHIGAKS